MMYTTTAIANVFVEVGLIPGNRVVMEASERIPIGVITALQDAFTTDELHVSVKFIGIQCALFNSTSSLSDQAQIFCQTLGGVLRSSWPDRKVDFGSTLRMDSSTANRVNEIVDLMNR